jgi:hypothetical protein
VSFGVNPNDANEITKGVGIYSTPYCLVAGGGGFGADFKSNCGISTAFLTAKPKSDGADILEVMNAIELNWALPYAVPSDRTVADIVCKTQVTAGAKAG